ncbi:amidase-like [Bradysia coprophila]|uniref:amidase-like n=1 Tax=Bradysia coprophila TaxID=38358 RepID=UPI00187DD233|nr:amidase-like [Bradysia coprophila]
MLPRPTLKDLQEISEEYNLNISDDKLSFYMKAIEHNLEGLNEVNAWKSPLDDKRLKYGNRPFHRATPQENPDNAWHHICNIKGGQNEDQAQLLADKKLAIKDNIFIGMVPLMNGSRTLEGFVPECDATVVERILNHGGTIVGNVTCENLCLSGASFNTTYGPVRNPWNTNYSAGGSSSGSGVVVAVGDVDMALGGDQAGSIRIPSSSCGIVGLKPTYGLVPYTGIISIVRAIDHVGPMARNVTDCARLLTAIAGFDDGKDDRQPSTGFQPTDYLAEVNAARSGVLRIGILKEGFQGCDDVIIDCIQNAIELIKSSNQFAEVTEVSVPDHSKASTPFFSPILFYATQDQLIDGCGYGTSVSGVLSSALSEKVYDGLRSHGRTLHDLAKQLIVSSAYVKKYCGHAKYTSYAKAQTWFWHIGKAYNKALEKVDVLLMPTLPILPVRIPSPDAPIREVMAAAGANLIKNTAPFDLTHHPAITLNAGYDKVTNLPIGLQLVGRLWDDATVLKSAKLIEDSLAELQKPFSFTI